MGVTGCQRERRRDRSRTSDCDWDGKCRWGFPGVTPNPGAPNLSWGLNAQQQPQRLRAFYLLLFQVFHEPVTCLRLQEAQPRCGTVCACLVCWVCVCVSSAGGAGDCDAECVREVWRWCVGA